MQYPIQFDWCRHWKRKVRPYLDERLVQRCLDFGMRLGYSTWRRGDAPFEYGAPDMCHDRDPRPGTLRWYQPLCRCHNIAFLSLAIGVLNFPELDWRIVTGELHSVPVGHDPNGEPKVVMDILLFEDMTAEESINHTKEPACEEFRRSCREFLDAYPGICERFIRRMVPRHDACQPPARPASG